MTTCPDCGKQFADDVLHPCRAGNIWLGNAPAETLEVRAPVPNDTGSLQSGPCPETPFHVGIGIGCTNPQAGCLDFLLDDGRHVVCRFDDVMSWSDGDTSSIGPGDERMVITLLAKVAKLLLQLKPVTR